MAKLDGKIVRFLGIHRFSDPKSQVGDVGVIIHPDHRKGISTKLLNAGIGLALAKGFRRLEADTLATNKAMRRTAEKAGFRLEGLRIKAINMHGQLKNEALFAFLI